MSYLYFLGLIFLFFLGITIKAILSTSELKKKSQQVRKVKILDNIANTVCAIIADRITSDYEIPLNINSRMLLRDSLDEIKRQASLRSFEAQGDILQIVSGIVFKIIFEEIIPDVKSHPFIISKKGRDLAKKIVGKEKSPREKARLIFNWMQENISYDHEYSYRKEGYHTAEEVLRKGKGVCGEQAYLFIVLVRSVGVKAQYVTVDRDCYDKKVTHACAMIDVPSPILVDPAYHIFDVKHAVFCVVSDSDLKGRHGR
ncbi:transglutaminase domain-containing protein [Candidatus Microgenomates bacterium]|nr:transglutaminase domain-containing protein [Candidatus Microgenomates bacterium]